MTTIDFIGMLAIISLIIVTIMICAAGILITGVCIFKVTEKIIKTIENFFDNL